MASHRGPGHWTGWLPPLLGLGAALGLGLRAAGWAALGILALLLLSVRAAVHHAEVVAARVGEPFGALILAIAVTVIEVALIASVMLAADPPNTTLLRDTILAVVMLVAAGLTGLCIVLAALRHREPGFNAEGASALLSVVVAMATLVLILPNHVRAAAGPEFGPVQQEVVAGLCLALYAVFVFVQTVRNRDYFIPHLLEGDGAEPAARPSGREAAISGALLLLGLSAVVLLAKTVAPAIEATVATLRLPAAVTGVVVAAIVLLPETATALRAARADRLQTSLNLALGSAVSTIGLSVPIVVALAAWIGQPLALGVSPADTVLLALTFLTGMLALSGAVTNLLQGCVLLVVFGAWLLTVFIP